MYFFSWELTKRDRKVEKENKSRSSNGLSHPHEKVIKLWVENLPLLEHEPVLSGESWVHTSDLTKLYP